MWVSSWRVKIVVSVLLCVLHGYGQSVTKVNFWLSGTLKGAVVGCCPTTTTQNQQQQPSFLWLNTTLTSSSCSGQVHVSIQLFPVVFSASVTFNWTQNVPLLSSGPISQMLLAGPTPELQPPPTAPTQVDVLALSQVTDTSSAVATAQNVALNEAQILALENGLWYAQFTTSSGCTYRAQIQAI